MSTVVYQDGFNLMIRSNEGRHRYMPHCHAVGQGFEARIHLETFEVLTNSGFGRGDLRKITAAVKYYENELRAKWEEYHGES
jgi:hypothetical protein